MLMDPLGFPGMSEGDSRDVASAAAGAEARGLDCTGRHHAMPFRLPVWASAQITVHKITREYYILLN
jgi:hypothetical protein